MSNSELLKAVLTPLRSACSGCQSAGKTPELATQLAETLFKSDFSSRIAADLLQQSDDDL